MRGGRWLSWLALVGLLGCTRLNPSFDANRGGSGSTSSLGTTVAGDLDDGAGSADRGDQPTQGEEGVEGTDEPVASDGSDEAGDDDGESTGFVDDKIAVEWPVEEWKGCPEFAPEEPNVFPGDSLADALADAEPGAVLALQAGTYPWAGPLEIDTDGVEIRAASGEPGEVVLVPDPESETSVIIRGANVKLMGLVLEGAHGIAIEVEGDGVELLGLTIDGHNGPAIAIQPGSDDGLIRCSAIEAFDDQRTSIESCELQGVTGRDARGWRITDNLISGIWCPGPLDHFGIRFAEGSQDLLIARNQLFDVQRGIVLGEDDGFGLDVRLFDRCDDSEGHVGGVAVVNNVVHVPSRAELLDSGISAWHVCDALIAHNTIVSPTAFASIDFRWADQNIHIRNNLTSHRILAREDAQARIEGNVVMSAEEIELDDVFDEFPFLRPDAIVRDRGAWVPDFTRDIEGEDRDDGKPDPGVDEVVE